MSDCIYSLSSNIDISDRNLYFRSNKANFMQLVSLYEKYERQLPTIVLRPIYKDLKNWIDECTPLLADPFYKYSTKIYWILVGLLFFPICRKCKSHEGYVHKNVASIREGYLDFCSIKCSLSSEVTGQNRIDANMRHYGVEFSFQAEEVKKKIKASVKKTTGYECALASPSCRAKGRETVKKLTNGKYEYMQLTPEYKLKHVLMSIERYGTEHVQSTDECRRRMKNGHASRTFELKKHSQELAKKTCLKKYGTLFYLQTAEFKARKLKTEDSRKRKEYATKKRNDSFKKSKAEDAAYQMLKFIFPKLQRQYKSKEYPFLADFYDPALPNVRFEFQGFWTHGDHAFDENSIADCMTLIEKLVEKGVDYFNYAFHTWIVRDPRKREIAKKNGIKLVEFWNLKEVRDFVIHFFDESK